MALRHRIRNREGGTESVRLTPIKAIRLACLECCGWSPKEVTGCTSPLCPLFPYRAGSNPERAGIGGRLGQKN